MGRRAYGCSAATAAEKNLRIYIFSFSKKYRESRFRRSSAHEKAEVTNHFRRHNWRGGGGDPHRFQATGAATGTPPVFRGGSRNSCHALKFARNCTTLHTVCTVYTVLYSIILSIHYIQYTVYRLGWAVYGHTIPPGTTTPTPPQITHPPTDTPSRIRVFGRDSGREKSENPHISF